MSIHVSPFYRGFSSRVPAGEIISSELIDGGRHAPHAAPDLRDPDADRLSIRLDAMGMVISLAATGQPAAPAISVAFASEAGNDGDDAVVRNCSRALAELDGRTDEFADVYADALRLAIVTRMLSLRARPAPELEAPAPAAQPVRSGLPKWRLKRVAAFVDENIGEAITLAGMAAAAGLSRMHFAAQFRIATGIRPHEYVMRRRIEHAQQMLRETGNSLVQIALSVGFQTQAHFTTVFRRFVGDTPYQWRCANCEAARA